MSAESQSHNVLPPEDGKIVCITLDATSRRYDLGALDLGGERVELGGTMFLSMQSSGDFHYKFSAANAGTVDETAADAAGAGPTFKANAAAFAPANQTVRVRWNRKAHRYLIVKGGTTILRLWVSSDKSTR